MAYFNGTFGADRITTTGVSAGVTADPFGSRPGDGGDIILGQGGDDYLSGGGGNDWIVGGADDDTIHGDTGSDGLYGGDGDDLIYNASPFGPVDSSRGDVVYGGNGNDRIHAVHFGRFYGDDDDDTFIIWPTTQSGYFFVNGGRGSDTLDFSVTRLFEDINLGTREVSAPNLVFREIENVIGNGLDNEIFADGQDNELRGAGGRDTIDGGNGDDLIWGDAGGDLIFGGRGHDEVHGGSGNDYLYGSWSESNYPGYSESWYDAPVPVDGSHDLVYGEAGNDHIFTSGYGAFNGGAGDDFLYVTAGGDQTVSGGSGIDEMVLIGERGQTILVDLQNGRSNFDGLTFDGIENVSVSHTLGWGGNAGGNAILLGDEADNHLIASSFLTGGAYIDGRGGDDVLWGTWGDDWLLGGSGNDTLRGREGDDILRGGDGADRLERNDWGSRQFVVGEGESAGWSHDTIVEFDTHAVSGDKIQILFDADTTRSGHQDFEFLGAVSDAVGLSHGAGHLWTVNTGVNTYVRGNVDGDRFLELTILIEDGHYQSAEDYTVDNFIL